MLMLGFFVMYAAKKYEYERDRYRMYERKEHIKDMPAHHFSNRGGVLMEKQFVGFEKYYKNGAALDDWYRRAFPN